MIAYTLDTNIVTALLKHDVNIATRLGEIALSGQQVFINAICYYEVRRGLLYMNLKSRTKRLRMFEELCTEYGLLLLDSRAVFDKASEIYEGLRSRGQLIPDADILIAALAQVHDLIVVSDNVEHFQRIPDISVENWLRTES